ncbi:MAG: class I SAM-dependent methyltransferase [Gemmatimonadales bacterium]|nr:class I SAM-dependent methyltransferase [Gemmatimonadales bacterium]
MNDAGARWAVALFNRSVLKQAKYRQISALLDDPAGKTSLDIGADNGVISYLLRGRGGRWHSADLDERAVASIRQLVQTDVHQLAGAQTPFPDATFDQVVVIDYLEHIPDDGAFARELARILKPGGRVIINVPHLKPRSLLNRFRHAIGLTDEWHGHVRPGYDVAGIKLLLGPRFVVERSVTYSGTFSELVDTGLNGLYTAMSRGAGDRPSSRKGTVVTQSDMQKHRKQFVLLTALYPALWATAKLDALLPFQTGYKLIVRARLTES